MEGSVYFHVDVNSAYLSWTAAYRTLICGMELDLRMVPSVIGSEGGKPQGNGGIVLAKSMGAKAYGIKTGEPLMMARQKCPGLLAEPPDYELYVRNSKAMVEMLREYSPDVIQYSIDECFMDMTGMEYLWGEPLVAARRIRNRIREELGFTVNIGISENRLLAKMASDFRKPDQCHTLFKGEIRKKMWPLPVSDLFFVGSAAEKKLGGLGIHTIGQLACTDVKILKAHLKNQGEVVWQYANGIDQAPYLTVPAENKGYGNSMTLPSQICSLEGIFMALLALCETIGARIRLDGIQVGVVSVSVTDCDFRYSSHQGQLWSATEVTDDIYRLACELFCQLWDGSPIRQIGVHTSKVSKGSGYQINLFNSCDYEKKLCFLNAVDEVRKRFGEDMIMRARFLGSPVSHMSGGLDPAKRQGVTKPL